ncbi:MAG TPA: O-antigen ligase family protein [Acidimicrobiales bacterium]|nr:O-antigen ligase family protein [Acidimicrobiales bacterium]
MAVTSTGVQRVTAPQETQERLLPGHAGGPAIAGGALLLIAALAASVANQGAYYRAGQWLVALLLGAAFVGALCTHPWSRFDARVPPLTVGLALAGWALVRAAFAGDVTAGLPTVAVVAGAVAVVATARRAGDLETLASAAVALGALLAATGWIGVVWRVSPWALEDQRLWRAATSLTYANAAAALLSALMLFALGRLVGRRASALERAALCLTLVGLGGTLSRGGIAAAGAGVVFLVAVQGFRPVARAAAAPLAGAIIALSGLLPSMPASSPPRPVVAALALAAGLAIAAFRPRTPLPRHRGTLVVVAAAGAVMFALAVGTSHAIGAVGRSRFTVSSPDRHQERRAALRLAAESPLTGVGPGQAGLRWVGPDGRTFVAKYAHNEYLQVLVELGAVGLGLVLALLLVTARRMRADRRTAPRSPLWSGAVAGLVALLVGSAFDFLWHVPAIPLFAALLVAFTVPDTERETENNEKQEDDTSHRRRDRRRGRDHRLAPGAPGRRPAVPSGGRPVPRADRGLPQG